MYKQDLDAKKAARERLEKENTERLQAYSADKQVIKEEEELLKKEKDLKVNKLVNNCPKSRRRRS